MQANNTFGRYHIRALLFSCTFSLDIGYTLAYIPVDASLKRDDELRTCSRTLAVPEPDVEIGSWN